MNRRVLFASALAGAPALLLSSPSFAEGPAQAFGRKGHLAISSDAVGSLQNTSVSGTSGSTTTLLLRPAADYFVVDRLSVGGYIPFAYNSESGGGGTSIDIGVGARVGYDIPLSGSVSFWPRAGISFTSDNFSASVGGTSLNSSNSVVGVNVFAPFLLHPVEHFFLGLGPVLSVDLTGKDQLTTYGISFLVGGHFLGD